MNSIKVFVNSLINHSDWVAGFFFRAMTVLSEVSWFSV